MRASDFVSRPNVPDVGEMLAGEEISPNRPALMIAPIAASLRQIPY